MVERPICGCGRTSALLGTLGGNCIGPRWSKKMKGPTMRRFANGRTRPTSKSPSDRRRASIIISSTGMYLRGQKKQPYFASIAPEQHNALLPEPISQAHRVQRLDLTPRVQDQRPLDRDPEIGGHVF